MSQTFPSPDAAPRKLVLASASQRRQQLLREAGYVFEIDPAEVDESAYPAAALPSEVARAWAQAKADAVAQRHPAAVVLGADTLVAFGDRIIGKPVDLNHAREILTLLSGTTHLVITGIAIVHPASRFSLNTRVMSAVRMKNLWAQQIDDYLAGGQWQGKAGAYGIQDANHDPFVSCLSGSFTNIVGLPMEATRRLLQEAGIAATSI